MDLKERTLHARFFVMFRWASKLHERASQGITRAKEKVICSLAFAENRLNSSALLSTKLSKGRIEG